MKKWFYYLFNYRKRLKERKKLLSNLYLDYLKWQNYLDHEGKMYGLCDYNDDDISYLKSIERKRDEAQKRYYELKYKKYDNNNSNRCCVSFRISIHHIKRKMGQYH